MIFYLVLFFYLLATLEGFSLSHPHFRLKRHTDDLDIQSTMGFLHRAGYIDIEEADEDQEITEEDTRKALRKFQRSRGFKETGELDEVTKREILKPRCGFSSQPQAPLDIHGLNLRRKDLVRKWRTPVVTYSIKSFTRDLAVFDIRLAFREAFDRWEQVIPLRFEEVTGEANIVVGFASQEHPSCEAFDGPGGVYAHAYFPPRGDLHVDDDEMWTNKDQEMMRKGHIDLFQIVLHEIGHAIGLDHINNSKAIMYATYSNDIKDDPHYMDPILHRDDIEAAQKLYGVPIHSTASPTTARPLSTLPPPRETNNQPTIKCPQKVDLFFADGNRVFIFDDVDLFELEGWKVVKVTRIVDLFMKLPAGIRAANFDLATKRIIFYSKTESSWTALAYFYSRFSKKYLRAEDKEIILPSNDFTGAIQSPRGESLLVTDKQGIARFDWRTGRSTPYLEDHFSKLPNDIRGGMRITEKTYIFFTDKKIIAYNIKSQKITQRVSLKDKIIC